LQSWEELEQKILEESSFKICILENIHFMYLKTVSGFGGLEKFLNLLSRTKYSVFWISTCTLYSWQFLQKAIGIDSYFQRLLTLYKITPDELKSIIMKTAIIVWLRSIKEFSKDKMVLSTNLDIDFRFLNGLSEENVLTLSAILHHEIMSPESHSEILNQNMNRSRLQLENLEGEGLLIKNGHGYQIHPFIYRPLVQILKKKNILS
jgi:hypothetical protein